MLIDAECQTHTRISVGFEQQLRICLKIGVLRHSKATSKNKNKQISKLQHHHHLVILFETTVKLLLTRRTNMSVIAKIRSKIMELTEQKKEMARILGTCYKILKMYKTTLTLLVFHFTFVYPPKVLCTVARLKTESKYLFYDH